MPNHFITKRYNRCISVAVNCYQIVINARAWRERVNIDKRVYAGHVQGEQVLVAALQSDYYSLSSCLKERKIKKLLAVVALLALIAALGVSTAYGNSPSIEAYKLYAHMRVGNDAQYRCLVELWDMESHWNSRADNKHSTAYGIPQVLGMKERDPYKQIDIGLAYITKRYKLPCKALAHHKRKGYY